MLKMGGRVAISREPYYVDIVRSAGHCERKRRATEGVWDTRYRSQGASGSLKENSFGFKEPGNLHFITFESSLSGSTQLPFSESGVDSRLVAELPGRSKREILTIHC